ncbi:MAG TPA: DNA-directed RNA polymerase subunit alpha C-terminal domain-containing protein [Candidatus Saccharibacteria bacterium]|nr:DNA-directed RNA polymerase subunit alpha C-terminal domain-containing protein [Candidatus Saccharibacteria bacterium]HMT39846.1 DNA-directed RNA polymerase subunit alpha C-terminal domain-containing protein [Candidatus Saccharibacteria bacterium]
MTYRTVVTLVLETDTLGLPMSAISELQEWAEDKPYVLDCEVTEYRSHLELEDETNILDWPLTDESLGFSTRVINSLSNPRRRKYEYGWVMRESPEDAIHSLGDLVSRDARTLLDYNNFGKSSLAEVRKVLSRYGLHLLGERRQPPRNS